MEDTIGGAQDEKVLLLQYIQGWKSKVSEQENAAKEAITDREEMVWDLEYYKDHFEQLTGKKKCQLDKK